MISETVLASLHHVSVFSLLGGLVAEWALLMQAPERQLLRRLATVDLVYGLTALLVVGVGIARIVYGFKPWSFYSGNPVFWVKMTLGGVIGLLSIVPTVRFLRWRRQESLPSEAEFSSTRKWVVAEVLLFVGIPICAAAMARGVGYA